MATKKKKIAILGFAASSFHEAPLKDKTWEIWGLNELWRAIPKVGQSVRDDGSAKKNVKPDVPVTDTLPIREDGRQAWDVWFEIHPRWSYERRPGHVAWMQSEPAGARPIYMQKHFDDIPASVPLPIDDLVREFGPYFTCGPAYMIAMAIMQKPGQIGIWGIDMLHDTEFAYQRACCDYLIGVARGKGIPVYVPETSSLGKAYGLYGYDTLGPKKRLYTPIRVKKRKEQITASRDDTLRQLYNIDGALETILQFGVEPELVKVIEDELTKARMPITPEQAGAMRELLAKYRQQLHAHVNEQREKGMQLMYSLDGSLQELGYWQDVAKHLERRGV